MVIDVNMGGFPLGRTGIIQCNKVGKIELEDLICITVSHLFKHEHAFMKDINDLFYLLRSAELNQNLLCEKLERYELLNLFKVAYCFLKKELHLSIEINIKNTCRISLYFYNTKEEIDKLIDALKNSEDLYKIVL